MLSLNLGKNLQNNAVFTSASLNNYISVLKSPQIWLIYSLQKKYAGSHTGLVLGVMVGMVRKLSQNHIAVKYHNVLGRCFEVASLCKEKEQHQKSCTQLFYM